MTENKQVKKASLIDTCVVFWINLHQRHKPNQIILELKKRSNKMNKYRQ